MVQEPMILDGEWVESVCTYMYMCSRMSGNTPSGLNGSKMSSVAIFPKASCLHSSKNAKQDPKIVSRQLSSDSVSREEAVASPSPPLLNETSSTVGSVPGGPFRPRQRRIDPVRRLSVLVTPAARSDTIEDSEDGRTSRWDLAAEAVDAYPAIRQRFKEMNYAGVDGEASTCLQEEEPEELLVKFSSNWSTVGLLHGEHGLVMGIILWFASMAFGGIHAAAWHNYFPSDAEAWIWRCSATYISWSGLVWLTINLSAKMFKPIDDLWMGQRLSRAPWVRSWLLAILCALCGSLYIFARLYLVVEAFMSIRQLPVGAYQTPAWTEILPHL